jgi:DNA mismatch repair protein MutS
MKDMFIEIQKFLDNQLFIDKCKNVSSITVFEECIIQPGVSNDLDDLLHSLESNNELFAYIHELLNNSVRHQDKKSDTNVEYVKIHNTEKSGATLQITKKRGLLLKSFVQEHQDEEIPKLNGTKWGEIKLVSASGNADEIDFPLLTKICRDILHQKEHMNKMIAKSYQEILEKIENEYYEKLEIVANYVAKYDVLINKAYIAKEYKYCKPVIDNASEKSFVNIKALRHVLIEHIQTKEIYVANDIELGKKQNGVLLYGTNAVGKTSFIRALGISIVMAQAGLYVPCASFQYKPYQAIFSRILGNDNLFKGLSTFAVEMSELRVILKLSNQNSLILGDELCSGTETESALSIFVSGLIDMHKKNASFIFATHFHEIIYYEEIQQLDQLSLKHMAVRYDRELDALVYDRKLMDGPGNRMYGLEVCKSLYLPEEFLQQAYAIRTKYFPESKGELSHSICKYNASKIRGLCEICNKELGSEIHHLFQQKDADEDGFIIQEDGGVIHKNHPANLMSVCEECHDNYHANEENMTLIRKKTSKGYKIEGL